MPILNNDEYEGEETFNIELTYPSLSTDPSILLVNADRAMPRREQSVTVTIRDDIEDLSTDATLSELSVNDGATDHTIDLTSPPPPPPPPYMVSVVAAVASVTLTATPTDDGATVSAVTLNGGEVIDSDFSDGITVSSLEDGENEIMLTVTAENDTDTQTYTVTVTRAATEGCPAGSDWCSTLTAGYGEVPLVVRAIRTGHGDVRRQPCRPDHRLSSRRGPDGLANRDH